MGKENTHEIVTSFGTVIVKDENPDSIDTILKMAKDGMDKINNKTCNVIEEVCNNIKKDVINSNQMLYIPSDVVDIIDKIKVLLKVNIEKNI